MNKYEYDCSYDFDKPEIANEYEFLVVFKGDLDLNGCIMLKDLESLNLYLEEQASYDLDLDKIQAVFRKGKLMKFKAIPKIELKDEN